MTKDIDARASSKTLAFAGVVMTTCAISVCLIAFPICMNYILMLQASAQEDLAFCQAKSRDLWREVFEIQHATGASAERMSKAIHLIRESDPSVNIDVNVLRQPRQAAAGSCCTCHKGGPGPAGAPGNDGAPGHDGEDGKPGENGAPSSPERVVATPIELCGCEPGPAGESGKGGEKGPPGPPGPQGPAGDNGPDGGPGPAGPPGKAGADGRAGGKGEAGPDGGAGNSVAGPAGPAGPPGPDGTPGPAGPKGPAGNPGRDGQPGAPGDAGPPGPDGHNGPNGQPGPKGQPGPQGSCAHCPPPRLAPGY